MDIKSRAMNLVLYAVVGAMSVAILAACGKDISLQKALDEVDKAIKANIERCRANEKTGSQIAPNPYNGKGLGYGINCPNKPMENELAKPECGYEAEFKLDGDVAGYLKIKNASLSGKTNLTTTSNKNLATHVHQAKSTDETECDPTYVWWETVIKADLQLSAKTTVDGKVFTSDLSGDLKGYKTNWTYIDSKDHAAGSRKCGPNACN